MKNLMNKIRKANKGFTLVELIIVIAIIAVLAAVAAPQYIKYVEKSRVSADSSTAAEIVNCAKVIATDTATGSFTMTWDKDANGQVVFAYTASGADSTAGQAAVNATLGNSVGKPTSKKVTADYVVTATYDANTYAWTFTESADLTSLAATT